MQRPTSATVFGILNLIFSVLGLCGTGFGIFSLLVFQNPEMGGGAQVPLTLELMRENPAYQAFTFVSIGLGAVSAILLAVSGIGLLKLRPWGRTLCIVYGSYTVLLAIASGVINVAVFAPELDKAQQQANPQATAEAMGGVISGAIGGCGSLIYPAILLGFMLFNQNLRRAFGADSPQPDMMYIPDDGSHSDSLS